ncbi:MAG: Holliday junction resolvase RuvX [Pseudomonadota bacterium]
MADRPIIFTDRQEAIAHCHPGGTAIGLDIGKVRIGVSISDIGYRIAVPAGTIQKKRAAERLYELSRYIQEYRCTLVVVGWPLMMDGTQGAKCQAVRQFVHNMRKGGITIAVTPWDERMTSRQVEHLLIDQADASRKTRTRVTDKLAASVILQGFLDYRREMMAPQ